MGKGGKAKAWPRSWKQAAGVGEKLALKGRGVDVEHGAVVRHLVRWHYCGIRSSSNRTRERRSRISIDVSLNGRHGKGSEGSSGPFTVLTTGVDGEPHHGTVALLWPMLATTIKAQLDGDAEARMYAIRELCERCVLSNVNGWHRVSLTYGATHPVGMVFAHGVPPHQFTESEIRERAYFLWRARGRRDGNDFNDWRDAEHELGPSS